MTPGVSKRLSRVQHSTFDLTSYFDPTCTLPLGVFWKEIPASNHSPCFAFSHFSFVAFALAIFRSNCAHLPVFPSLRCRSTLDAGVPRFLGPLHAGAPRLPYLSPLHAGAPRFLGPLHTGAPSTPEPPSRRSAAFTIPEPPPRRSTLHAGAPSTPEPPPRRSAAFFGPPRQNGHHLDTLRRLSAF